MEVFKVLFLMLKFLVKSQVVRILVVISFSSSVILLFRDRECLYRQSDLSSWLLWLPLPVNIIVTYLLLFQCWVFGSLDRVEGPQPPSLKSWTTWHWYCCCTGALTNVWQSGPDKATTASHCTFLEVSASNICSSRARLQPWWPLVLLRWQEFATRGGVFLDMPPLCQCRCRRWQISVCVKTRVVNRKQVDVAASRSRSFQLSWNALIARCTGP